MMNFRNLALAGSLMLAGAAAHAVPVQWTDNMDFDNAYVGPFDPVTYTHNITDDNNGVGGYNIFTDSVDSYQLSITLGDDNKGWDEYVFNESALVFVGGLPVSFTFGNPNAGYSFTGHAQLDILGSLTVSITSGLSGSDFYLKNSFLTVNGQQAGSSTSVPEPATLGLMGLGMLGVGFAARRRKA